MQRQLAHWVRTSTPRSREMVLEVLNASHPTPLHSQDIYQRVLKQFPEEKVAGLRSPLHTPPLADPAAQGTMRKKNWKPPPDPPQPDHPIRSYTYLKSTVLADLAHRNEVIKVHTMREPTPEELARKNERPSKARKKNKSAGSAPSRPVAFNVKGMIDQWGWVLKTAERLQAEKEERVRVQKAIEGQKMLDTKKADKEKQKAFEEEWGHLNVRRRRAREGKLEREDEWARVLDRERQEGRVEAQRETA